VIGKIVAQNIENDSDEATIELAGAHFTDFCRGPNPRLAFRE
jgi:hypothetical protein